ncbi:MAG TPA: hypothetical protein VMU51_28940 [Mycobacteriales bacterium]|nr:hypothetical protein [Mycobacteriales bacterium]
MTRVIQFRPHERPPRRALARTLVPLLAALGLAVPGLSPASAAPPASRSATAPGATLVPLVTGDWVQVHATPDGRQTAAFLARDRHGLTGSFRTERRNGDLFVFPAVVSPYLGRVLDPALFDVTQLTRAGYTAATSQLPLRLTYRAGAAHHAVPGVTVTRTQGNTVDGYLTPASARAFGAALAAQVRADAPAHWPIGGMFAGLTGIRYAGAAASPPVQPHFPMVTLRVTVTGGDGQPAPFGDLAVVNTDDVRKVNGFPFVVDGEARISVPTGHYGLLLHTFDLVGDTVVDRVVNITDYQLSRAQTLAVDMRSATVPLAVHTPRAGVVDAAGVDWGRTDANGLIVATGLDFGEGFDVRVAPGPAARFGQLNFSTRFHVSSPAGEPAPYSYDLQFGATGQIPPSQTYQVTPAELTTVHARYHADGQREAASVRMAVAPWVDFLAGLLTPVTVPGERVEYVRGQSDVLWLQDYVGVAVQDFSDPDNPVLIFAAEFFDGFRRYTAGTELTVEMARPVLRPGLDFDTGLGPFAFVCPACRQGDSVGIFLTPVADTVPGHFGFVDFAVGASGPVAATSRMRLFRDGTLIQDEADTVDTTIVVPAATATYRLLFDATRTAPWYTQDTRSQTEWTFTSGRPAGRTAPASWLCSPLADGSLPPGDCAVLPLLRLDYAAPVDLTGRVPGGVNHLGISVAPTQGAPDVAVTGAGVEVSFDDGASWTTAAVTATGGGRFDAVFTAPAAGFVSTRVHATDAAGNAITQTVIRAYTVGAA